MEIELLDAEGRPRRPLDGSPRPRPRAHRPRTPVRTAGLVGAAVLVVLVVTAGAASSALADRRRAERDDELRARAEQVASLVARAGVDAAVDAVPDGLLVQVLQSPGVVVATSPGLAGAPISSGVAPRGGVELADEDLQVGEGVSAHRVAAVVLPSPPGVASATVVAVARPEAPLERSVARLRASGLAVAAAGALAAAAATWRRADRRPTGGNDRALR